MNLYPYRFSAVRSLRTAGTVPAAGAEGHTFKFQRVNKTDKVTGLFAAVINKTIKSFNKTVYSR